MRKNFVYNIRSSVFQFVINQGAGLLIFYILSEYLSKTEFGEINWTLALYFTFFNILPFGMDQVSVQKIASGKAGPKEPTLYFFHVAVAGLVFYGLVLLCSFIFPAFFQRHTLLLLLGLGKLLFFFSMPFKQIITGLERFSQLMYISVVSNLTKLVALGCLAFYDQLQLQYVVLVFVLADGLELLASAILYSRISNLFPFTFNFDAYRSFLKECLPQAGTAIFSTALSRLDWILIGIFLSAGKLGEYSFAYKVFEFSTLPLLIVAPLLVPLFSRYLKDGRSLSGNTKIRLLLKLELIIACLTALALNILWVPLIEPLTQGRYGKVNNQTIFLLSLSLPLLYLNNFLWSLHFATGRIKMILRIFACTFFVNLVLNSLLIPIWGNEGAALAFVVSILTQTILYSVNLKEAVHLGWKPALVASFAALCSGALGTLIFSPYWLILSFSILLYLLLLYLTMQLRINDWKKLSALVLKRSNH